MGVPPPEGSPNVEEPPKSAFSPVVPPLQVGRAAWLPSLSENQFPLLPLGIYLPSRLSPAPRGSPARGRLLRGRAKITLRDNEREVETALQVQGPRTCQSHWLAESDEAALPLKAVRPCSGSLDKFMMTSGIQVIATHLPSFFTDALSGWWWAWDPNPSLHMHS